MCGNGQYRVNGPSSTLYNGVYNPKVPMVNNETDVGNWKEHTSCKGIIFCRTKLRAPSEYMECIHSMTQDVTFTMVTPAVWLPVNKDPNPTSSIRIRGREKKENDQYNNRYVMEDGRKAEVQSASEKRKRK